MSFDGSNRFLSNFYPADVRWEGLTFPTVEHAFQAAKTDNPRLRATIAKAGTPGDAKRMGRALDRIPEWDRIRVSVMAGLLFQKFAIGPLQTKLLATGSVPLIEGNNWHDEFWGVCRCERHGQGANHLGVLLMSVRTYYDTVGRTY